MREFGFPVRGDGISLGLLLLVKGILTLVFQDLRDFIDTVDQLGELRRINGADWDLDIGALTEMVAEGDLKGHPALLFDDIKGYPSGYRVLSNILTNVRRNALVLGLDPDTPPLEALRYWKDKVAAFQPIPPTVVADGPIFENVDRGDDVDIFKFPTPRWHENDPGRFIGTGNMVIMKDPDGDWINIAAQRNMVFERDKIGILPLPGKTPAIFLQKAHERGENVPVVICFGQEPLTWIPAGFFFPYGQSEFNYIGHLRGEPLEVVRGPLTGLPFPATAEIVIEGHIPPMEVDHCIEGPFGEFTGYYAAGPHPQPVVKIEAVYHRNDPILFGVPPLKPPVGPYTGIPLLAADTWDALEKSGIPDVVGVWQPVSRLMTVVSIRQRFAGHAKSAGLVAAGARGTAYFIKYVVVVDDDIDITSLEDVMWAVVTRCNPEESMDIIRETWGSSLDPSLSPEVRLKMGPGAHLNSKVIINACKNYKWIKDYPLTNRVSEDVRKSTRKKYREFFEELERV